MLELIRFATEQLAIVVVDFTGLQNSLASCVAFNVYCHRVEPLMGGEQRRKRQTDGDRDEQPTKARSKSPRAGLPGES